MSHFNSADTVSAIGNRLVALRQSSRKRIMDGTLIARILEGAPPKHSYIRYLKNVYLYAIHSAVVIGLAGARAVHRSPPVAAYLLHHATEKTGNEARAFSDLKELGVSEKEILGSKPTANCLSMIGMEYYYAAHSNPVALLGWMYTLQSLGEDIGHLVATKVSEGLSFGRRATSFLRGHADADYDHVKGVTETITRHVPPVDLAELLYVAEISARFYGGLISDALE